MNLCFNYRDNSLDKFESMRVFCSVIEAGGFAAAAEQTGLSTSAVSRHVAQLEAHLNVRLFNRTTRRMSPTDAGFAYFERCTQLLADFEETEASVSGEARHPHGRLRLAAPIALSVLRLAPAFAAFSQVYPEITLDIVLSDNVNDFTEEGLDLAIRIGWVGSENVVARHIGETALLIAAAPAYLARAGSPLTPDELTGPACFTYAFSATGSHWELVDHKGEALSIRVGGSIKANNGMFLAEMAVAGSDIVYAPCFILLPLIDRGLLVRLLPDWETRRLPIHAVYPTRRHLSAKVRAMTAFLTEWFEKQPDQAH